MPAGFGRESPVLLSQCELLLVSTERNERERHIRKRERGRENVVTGTLALQCC